jgi:DNA-binding NarL/FixJ family response regulator
MRVIIAHRHRLWREAVVKFLSVQPGLEVAAEVEDGASLVKLACDLKPDVAVIDISLPQVNGIAATEELRRAGARAEVILVLSHRQWTLATGALKAGVLGLVLNEARLEDLVSAIRRVATGRRFLSPPLAELIIDDVAGGLRGDTGPAAPRAVLTSREREVLQLLSEGHPTKAVAKALHVSPRTVETHRSQIMRKLDLHSVAALTKYAIREGLTALDT